MRCLYSTEIVEKIVLDYLNKKWWERGSKNVMKAHLHTGSRCWVSDTEHPNYLAGRKATKVIVCFSSNCSKKLDRCTDKIIFQCVILEWN